MENSKVVYLISEYSEKYPNVSIDQVIHNIRASDTIRIIAADNKLDGL